MSRRSFGAIRKLPSGRYQASHLHPDTGKRINAPRTFPTRKLAADWLKAQDVDLARGTWAPPKPKTAPVTFAAYADQWITRRTATLKPRTIAEYRRIAAVLEPVFGPVPLPSITADMVADWYAGMDASKPSERAARAALLRTILGAAASAGLIGANPARLDDMTKPKRAREIHPATGEQIATITAAMPSRWALMVQLGVWCGLRFGEMAALTRADVDLAAGVIHIRRAVSVIDGHTVIHDPKSDDGKRTVTIPPHLAPAVASHMAVYAGPALLFTAARSTRSHVSHGTISKAWATARKAAGRPDLRIHDLRHTGASLMAEAGASVPELQEWLGHSTPTMSAHYVHVSSGRRAVNAAALSALATA